MTDLLKAIGMNDTGILTFHRCINYGSFWQAYALVHAVRRTGRNAVILDHFSRQVEIAEWKCALQPVLPTTIPAGDYPLYREKIIKFSRCIRDLPLSDSFSLENPSDMPHYELVITGSDEVWNLFHPWYGSIPLFFGEGAKAERLVSYAACFGNYDAGWGLSPAWVRRLRNFEHISVRDENSFWLIKNDLGLEPRLVLDPCLAFDLPSSLNLSAAPEKHIAIYGHNFSPRFAEHIRSCARKRKLKLLSIGYRNDWADAQWITADPHEFAMTMRSASAVVTNFFHGCVFALRYSKPFICEQSHYRNNKIYGLAKLTGCEKHLLNQDAAPAAINKLLENEIDPGIISAVEELRHLSQDFLTMAVPERQAHIA